MPSKVVQYECALSPEQYWALSRMNLSYAHFCAESDGLAFTSTSNGLSRSSTMTSYP